VKTKHIITAALVVALVLLAVSQFRACKLDKKYRDMKAAYETERRIAEADHALSMGRIDELTNAIGQMDEAIVQKDIEITQKAEQIKVLSRDLAYLIANEPPTTPDIESMPIVINLRGQLSKLTEMYSLCEQAVTLQSEEIDVLKGKCIALGAIGEEWRVQYDKEHALRLSAEGLFKLGEHRVGLNKTIAKVAVGVAAIVVVGSLLKK
jgi:hypothetical protein